MQSALYIQSTFLGMSCTTTAAYLPHTALELYHAETTTSASQLEAHLQLAPVEQFPEITMLKYNGYSSVTLPA
jgi:hypothetical protein